MEHESILLTRHHEASLADTAKSQVADFQAIMAFCLQTGAEGIFPVQLHRRASAGFCLVDG
jgi:hypothetical protein